MFISYLAATLIAFASITLIFTLTIRNHLVNDTIERLHREAENLSRRTAVRTIIPSSGQARRGGFNLPNILVYAEYILLYNDGVIIDSSNHELYLPGSVITDQQFFTLIPDDRAINEYTSSDLVAVIYPVTQIPGQNEVFLILYSKLNILSELSRNIMHILSFSLAAGLAVALVAGSITTGIIIKPINQLKIMVSELSKRRYNCKLSLNTGDELQELAEAFNDMSQKLAEHEQSQELFFQRASHELKTPLMSVQGYAEALKDGLIDTNETAEALNIIIREAKRMKSLVEEFIFLSKIETTKPEKNLIPVFLASVADEAIEALKGLAKDKIINKHHSGKREENIICADREMIYRLILNIAANALRYAHRQVKIETGHKTITIIDDGPGFSEEELDLIFRPFYCGKGGESGLGLTIAKAIAEKYGGNIFAANHSGGGAEVKVIFN